VDKIKKNQMSGAGGTGGETKKGGTVSGGDGVHEPDKR